MVFTNRDSGDAKVPAEEFLSGLYLYIDLYIFNFMLAPELRVGGSAGAYPSCHRVKAGFIHRKLFLMHLTENILVKFVRRI